MVFGTNRVVTFRWPAGHTNIVLQGATNLTTNTVWTVVTNGITQTNGLNSFTIAPDLSLPFAFYRLYSSTPIDVPPPGIPSPEVPTLPPFPTSTTNPPPPQNDEEEVIILPPIPT